MLFLSNANELYVVIIQIGLEFFLPDRQDTAAARSPGSKLKQHNFLSSIIGQVSGGAIQTRQLEIRIQVPLVRADVRGFLARSPVGHHQGHAQQADPQFCKYVIRQWMPPIGVDGDVI